MKRFPKDFMFQLSRNEFENIRFQIEALEKSMSSQIVMIYPNRRPNIALPYAFTEQGVASAVAGVFFSYCGTFFFILSCNVVHASLIRTFQTVV